MHRLAVVTATTFFVVAAACASFDDAPSTDAVDPGSDGGSDGESESGSESDAGNDVREEAGPSRSDGYAAAILADGPLAYWRMGHVETGNVIPDQTPGKNDLVLTGAPDFAVDASGIFDDDHAVWFGGASGHATPQVSAPFLFNGSAPFTIECWARRELTDAGTPGQTYQHLLSFVDGFATPLPSTANGYLLFLRTDAVAGTYASHGALDGGAVQISSALAPPSQWTHYAMVMNGASIVLFVNGQQQDSTPVKGVITTRAVSFTVAKAANDPRYFRGFLDEIAVYDKALPAAQLFAHYKIARP